MTKKSGQKFKYLTTDRSSYRRCSKKFRTNLQQNSCARASFLIKLQAGVTALFKKETLAHVLSCEFCEISKNTVFTEHLWATASETKITFNIK